MTNWRTIAALTLCACIALSFSFPARGAASPCTFFHGRLVEETLEGRHLELVTARGTYVVDNPEDFGLYRLAGKTVTVRGRVLDDHASIYMKPLLRVYAVAGVSAQYEGTLQLDEESGAMYFLPSDPAADRYRVRDRSGFDLPSLVGERVKLLGTLRYPSRWSRQPVIVVQEMLARHVILGGQIVESSLEGRHYELRLGTRIHTLVAPGGEQELARAAGSLARVQGWQEFGASSYMRGPMVEVESVTTVVIYMSPTARRLVRPDTLERLILDEAARIDEENAE